MGKKDKNNQNINSIPKYLWGDFFKKPIKWLAHLINNYGNTKLSIYPTGTAFVYALSDERKKHPELTYQQVVEKVRKLYSQTRKNIGLPTEITPSLSAAGLAITGGTFSPWFAIPDIVFDVAASIDEPSTSNNIHTITDFPETVAKFTPSKIDDYVAKGVLTLGNIDDAVSTRGRNMFSNFDKKPGKINNTTDKTSVRESTNIKYRKQGGKMNILEFLKNGSGIHIKEKNKGKFTSYCGGKVTDECILKGKNSSNPAIRKRATFAANARKWKQGGILKGLFGLTARQRADSTYSAANESTFVKKPEITDGKKIIKNELSENAYDINNEDRVINSYPNLKNDKYVLEFFEYDYAPRFQRQNRFAPLLYVNLAKNVYSNTPINVYNNNDDFAEGGYEYNNNAGTFLGFDSLANPQVYLNNKYKLNRPVLVHELTHVFRQGILGVTGDNRFSSYKTPINLLPKVSIGKVYKGSGYTSSEKDKLNKAYNMDGYKINYDPLYEKGTTNTEVRFRLWKELYDKLGRRPTLEETDKFIRGYDNNRLGKTIRNANGYGWQMYQNGINLNDAKDALINVAMNDTPESNDYVDYAKKGIKIRKAQAGLVTPEMELSRYQGDKFRKFQINDIRYKQGGIIKANEGTKLTFGLRLGNFANSDLGKSVISSGLSFLLNKLFNKSASSNLEIALAAQEKELSTIDPMQVAQMIEMARNQYADPENPNANGGDIFNSYIKNQITAPILARQLEEHKKRLAAIDLLTNQAKSSVVGTFFNTLAQGGIKYLLNKYGTTEKADS